MPYIPVEAKPNPEARVFWIDIDPVKSSIPLFTFPADIRVQADSAKALPALIDCIKGRLRAEERQAIGERREAVATRIQKRRQERVERALGRASERPIAPEWLAYSISRALDQDTIVLDESVTNAPLVAHILERTQPGTQFGSGGSSLGWGLGAALGVKLAAPEHTVVTLVGDGAFIFGCPTATLWASAAYNAPFLTVIFNNQMYYAAKRSWLGSYPSSYGQRTGRFIGVDLSPSPDFALLARACHAYGKVVEDPGELAEALKRGLEVVRGGQAAVLDVRIQRP